MSKHKREHTNYRKSSRRSRESGCNMKGAEKRQKRRVPASRMIGPHPDWLDSHSDWFDSKGGGQDCSLPEKQVCIGDCILSQH